MGSMNVACLMDGQATSCMSSSEMHVCGEKQEGRQATQDPNFPSLGPGIMDRRRKSAQRGRVAKTCSGRPRGAWWVIPNYLIQ